jgi:hypothetical protein
LKKTRTKESNINRQGLLWEQRTRTIPLALPFFHVLIEAKRKNVAKDKIKVIQLCLKIKITYLLTDIASQPKELFTKALGEETHEKEPDEGETLSAEQNFEVHVFFSFLSIQSM